MPHDIATSPSRDAVASTDLASLRASVESLRAVAADTALGAINALPLIGGPLAAWLTQYQQRELFKRFLSVMDDVVERLIRLESTGGVLNINEEYVELLSDIGADAARTRDDEKRRYYAHLLVKASISDEAGVGERAKAMAALLGLLELRAMQTFQKIMKMPHTQSVHGLWGPERTLRVDYTMFSSEEGDALNNLEAQRLVDLGKFLGSRRPNGEGDLIVTARGVRFWAWISGLD